jgi:hypothetical protein
VLFPKETFSREAFPGNVSQGTEGTLSRKLFLGNRGNSFQGAFSEGNLSRIRFAGKFFQRRENF